MENKHPFGNPFTVLNFFEDFENSIANEQLIKMFEHPDVKTMNIVALSIVGPYRKGKSLFLNYCLRYLYGHYPSLNFPNNSNSNSKDWMGMDDEPLVGFSWRSGSNPDTKGIVMWNDVFFHVKENGEKIGIVLIDTQGLFNNDSTQTENSRIFALGTLISSIQVFNLAGVVQEDQLQYLQFATEYAKFALSDDITDEKPFQKLFFLIRDWDNPKEYPFGCAGGEKYLQRLFNSKINRADELKSVYEYINNLYQDLSCSLLPNPGKIVTQGINKNQNEKYDGSLAGMDEDFKEELAKVIDEILSPKKLIPKRIKQKYLNGSEFLDHMLQYFKFYLTNKAPEVQTVLESIVENEMKALLTVCVNKYKEEYRMNQINLNSLDQMQNHHDNCKASTIVLFKDSIKIGEPEDEVMYMEKLAKQLDSIYYENVKQFEANEKKIEEEKRRVQMELEMKHHQELEEIKRKIEAQRKIQEMKLQKMKDDLEQKKRSIADEILKAKEQAEKERKDSELKSKQLARQIPNYTADKSTKPIASIHNSQFQSNQALETSERRNLTRNNSNDYSFDAYHSNQNMQNVQPREMQYNDPSNTNTDPHYSNQHHIIPQEMSSYGTNQLMRNDHFTRELSMPANTFSWAGDQPNLMNRNQFNKNDQTAGQYGYQQAALPSRQGQYDRPHNAQDQFRDDFSTRPKHIQSTNPFCEDFVMVENPQISNQSFDHYNQQQHSNMYNSNLASNQLVPVNANFQQFGGAYNPYRDNQELAQRRFEQQRIGNNFPVLCGENSNAYYVGRLNNLGIQQLHDQPNTMSHMQNDPNYPRSNNTFSSTANHSSFEIQKRENEKEMEENEKRIAEIKATIIEDSQRKTDEMEKKLQIKEEKRSFLSKLNPFYSKKSQGNQITYYSEENH